MNKLLCLILFLFCSVSFLFVQSQVLVKGSIFDSETGFPVSEVHVIIKGNDKGTITDLNGNYSIYVSGKGDTLIYSHIQYNTYEKIIKGGENDFDIYLEPSVNILSNAVVKPVINISSGMLFDVSDYCFIDDNILLLGYFNNKPKEKNPWLVFRSPLGDTIFSQSIGVEGSFYKDCFNNVHYLTEKMAFQLYIENDSVLFVYPTDIDTFIAHMFNCEMEINNKILFSYYMYDNQLLMYCAYDKYSNSYDTVRVLADAQKFEWYMMREYSKRYGFRPPIAEDEGFNSVMYSKVSAPVIKVKDTVYILNYQDSKIESYDTDFNLLNNVNINFDNMFFRKEEIITDEFMNKVYAVIKNKNNGKTSVREIFLDSGILGEEMHIPDFYWIENTKVKNNKLYFLYKEKFSSKLQALYMMNLN